MANPPSRPRSTTCIHQRTTPTRHCRDTKNSFCRVAIRDSEKKCQSVSQSISQSVTDHREYYVNVCRAGDGFYFAGVGFYLAGIVGMCLIDPTHPSSPSSALCDVQYVDYSLDIYLRLMLFLLIWVGSIRVGSIGVESIRVESIRFGSIGVGRSGSDGSGSNRSGSNRSRSDWSGSNRSGSDGSGSNRSGSDRSGSDYLIPSEPSDGYRGWQWIRRNVDALLIVPPSDQFVTNRNAELWSELLGWLSSIQTVECMSTRNGHQFGIIWDKLRL